MTGCILHEKGWCSRFYCFVRKCRFVIPTLRRKCKVYRKRPHEIEFHTTTQRIRNRKERFIHSFQNIDSLKIFLLPSRYSMVVGLVDREHKWKEEKNVTKRGKSRKWVCSSKSLHAITGDLNPWILSYSLAYSGLLSLRWTFKPDN